MFDWVVNTPLFFISVEIIHESVEIDMMDEMNIMCDGLRDLVLVVQLKNRKKHP